MVKKVVSVKMDDFTMDKTLTLTCGHAIVMPFEAIMGKAAKRVPKEVDCEECE